MRTISILLALILNQPAVAGELEDLLELEEGQVTFSFATRDGVWGDGRSIRICDEYPEDDWSEWVRGPLHALLSFVDGELDEVEYRVAKAPRPHHGDCRDLGELKPTAAVDLLLGLARSGRGRELETLIFPATLARGVETWPELLAMARDENLDRDLRQQAVFWLGQDAARAAGEGLRRILEDDSADLELKEQAIFALSQHEGEKAYDCLAKVVLESPHVQLREQAIFWLAQSEDPRVLPLFESILLEP
jgi:hypothetical protein